MNNRTFTSINLIICIVSISCCIIVIGSYFMSNNSERTFDVQNISLCENLSLDDTSYCLMNWVRGFYNYTIRSDEIRTLEDIQKNGGDCFDYNYNLYQSMGQHLGFDTKTVTMKVGDSYHVITILSDSTGYCILDQTGYPRCVRLKVDNNDTKSSFLSY